MKTQQMMVGGMNRKIFWVFPLKRKKTQLPSTCITIYGIVSLLLYYKSKRSITLRELQSLHGLLNFACSVIIPVWAFLRRLFDLTIGQILFSV
jgi:hypothetical protein